MSTYEELEEALVDELKRLWNDLHWQILSAIDCRWSIGALNVRDRIARLTALVGPLHWRDVPMPLLLNGTYSEVHDALGVAVDEVPPEELEKIRQWERRQGVCP